MTWDAIDALSSVIGTVAVVVSLVYLAIQVRNQNKESRLAAIHEISVAFRDSMTSLLNDDNASLILKANADVNSLNDNERLKVLVLAQRFLRVWEEAYFQYTSNRLDNRIWQNMVAQYLSLLGGPGMAYAWEMRKQFFDGEFRTFVDGLERSPYVIRPENSTPKAKE